MAAWDWVGGIAGRIKPPLLARDRPGEKAQRMALRLRSSITLDDFYRSLCTDWAGHCLIPWPSGRAGVIWLHDLLPQRIPVQRHG